MAGLYAPLPQILAEDCARVGGDVGCYSFNRSGLSPHTPCRSPGTHSRCGLHTRAVTKIVTVIRRLQTFRRPRACSGCFRLQRSPGGPCTHGKAQPFHDARGEPTFAEAIANERLR
jgi:hypothetical protein